MLSIVGNTNGNIMPMAAAGMLVSLGLVGGAVDLGRAYMVQARLQAACDAGVLAGRTAVTTNGFDRAAQARAVSYFNANFDESSESAHDTRFDPVSEDHGNTIAAAARTTVDPVTMQVFKIASIDLKVNCLATLGAGNTDVTMVLDVTGSMNDPDTNGIPKIEGLREAMMRFYDTLDAATRGSNARVRYAFVPYSSAVNVSDLIADNELPLSYLADTYEYQSRRAKYDIVYNRHFDHWDGPKTSQTVDIDNEETDKSWTRVNSPSWRYESDPEAACNAYRAANRPDEDWHPIAGSDVSGPDQIIDQSTGDKTLTTTTKQHQESRTYRCAKSSKTWFLYYLDSTRDRIVRDIDTYTPVEVETEERVYAGMMYEKRTFDTRAYKSGSIVATPTGPDNAWETSAKWAGCILERDTIAASQFGYKPGYGIYAGADDSAPLPDDLNIDMAPTGSANAWAPMWPEITYRRGDRIYERYFDWSSLSYTSRWNFYPKGVMSYTDGARPTSYCPASMDRLEVRERGAFEDFANKLAPAGSTYHDIGMLWGARLSSPTGIFAENVNERPIPDNNGTISRHLIFMTDGEMAPTDQILSSYGMEYWEKRITGSDGTSRQTARHSARLLAICEAIKHKGIKIWVVAFGTALTHQLITCASDRAAYEARNKDELSRQFQNIAKLVGELRVNQ